jgi:hypothetical protein
MVRGFPVNWNSRRVIAPILLLIGGVLLLPGCGGVTRPKPVPVKGTVTFRGKPLPKARVTFFAKGAPAPATGETNDAGEFELSMYGKGDGALVGENTVTVVALSTGGGPMMPPDATKLMSGGEGTVSAKAEIGSSKVSGPAASLPKLYGDSSNTPLKWTVKPEGETDAKIELK